MMTTPVFQLSNIVRFHVLGGQIVQALDGVSLEIVTGEFVAIVGASGSGKSTLMTMLGCLDRADSGRVDVFGTDVSKLGDAGLATLRGTKLGFVFQNYHLFSGMSALENVALAGLYAGISKADSLRRAEELLADVGLADRMHHRPTQLSGGQQQRVAVARALFHQHAVILADEPTGALDSRATQALLSMLQELQARGRTIVLVTHDPAVARVAGRVITIADGRIIDDTLLSKPETERASPLPSETFSSPETSGGCAPVAAANGHASDGLGQENAVMGRWTRRRLDLLQESVAMALRLMRHRLTRTALTLFGIMIGIAAVIVIVAVGDGAKRVVVQTVASLGRNLVVVMTDRSRLPPNAPIVQNFSEAERAEIAAIPGIVAAALEMPISRTVTADERSTTTLVTAVQSEFPFVHDWTPIRGSFFNSEDETSMAAVIVLGSKVAERLFPGSDALGQTVVIESSLFNVIGVMSDKGASPAGVDLDDVALIPFQSAVLRLGQESRGKYLMVKTAEWADPAKVSNQIDAKLEEIRGDHEAVARTLDGIVALQMRTKDTLTALLAALSLISLVVGAVGITNITLIGVVERTREIGLRKAIGASNVDIALQFLIETVILAVVGGIGGLLFGVLCVLGMVLIGFPAQINLSSVLAALTMAAVTGIVAGIVPARRAAQMHPVAALASP